MSLKLKGFIELPANLKEGGFDHAAIHTGLNRLYVAHTANDVLDVIDCLEDRYLHSIPDLKAVAGALVSEESNLIFSSNRGENTLGIFSPEKEAELVKIPVGIRPNGVAFDPRSGLVLVAHVGDPKIPDSTTISLIHADEKRLVATISVPGRTRWTVFDAQSKSFYVNIMEPAFIIEVMVDEPNKISRSFPIPVSGPHGLDLDAASRRLFCACDGGQLVTVDIASGKVLEQVEIGGVPDVIFFNPALKHLYVAIGDLGLIEVFDTEKLERLETIETEKGAHTLAFDSRQNKVYAFLPQTHQAAVYVDEP
jgi:DNA-binding beta-propeller fold protein YncE